jgi:hypothetical protein
MMMRWILIKGTVRVFRHKFTLEDATEVTPLTGFHCKLCRNTEGTRVQSRTFTWWWVMQAIMGMWRSGLSAFFCLVFEYAFQRDSTLLVGNPAHACSHKKHLLSVPFVLAFIWLLSFTTYQSLQD